MEAREQAKECVVLFLNVSPDKPDKEIIKWGGTTGVEEINLDLLTHNLSGSAQTTFI